MTHSLDLSSPLPLYHQLEMLLRDLIARGEFRRGESIPPEMELANRFGVSRGTMRQALDRLTRAGLITRERGRGSFVAESPVEYPIGRHYSFAHAMADRGLTESSTVISKGPLRTPREVANALWVGVGTTCFRIVRVRYAGDHPLLLETSYLPISTMGLFDDVDLTSASIYDVLAGGGYGVTRISERVTPVLLGKRHASLLEVEPNSAAFAVERISFAHDVPVEWRSVLGAGKNVTLTAEWSI